MTISWSSPLGYLLLVVRLLVLAARIAHNALKHVANSVGSGLLLRLLIHRLARRRGVGSSSSSLSTLSGGFSRLDVDNLVLAQGSSVACTASAPLEVLLRFAAGARMSVHVLRLAGDVWVDVGLHVTLASSSGRVCLGLDCRGLEIGGLHERRGRSHVACSTATVR